MKIMFLGHGSPMMALESNSLTRSLGNWSKSSPKPDLILAISAHWVSLKPSAVTASKNTTMYDFGGFPQQLYQIKYEPPGEPKVLELVEKMWQTKIEAAPNRGLDHGVWTTLKWLYPEADVPVVQISMEAGLTLSQHFERGQKLAGFEQISEYKNVLLIASGNITHNLRALSFDSEEGPAAWAIEFDSLIKKALENQDWQTLTQIDKVAGELFWQAHPSIEHYVPLLYAAGAVDALGKSKRLELEWLSEEIQAKTLAMRSAVWS